MTNQTTYAAQKLGPYSVVGNPNKVINGETREDQRNAGSSVAFTNTNVFPVDRFHAASSSLSTQTISGQRVASTITGFNYSLKATVGGTGAAPASGAYAIFGYKMEGYDAADLLWGTASAKPLTVSFWAKSSVTGTYAISIRNSANDRSYVKSFALTAATAAYISLTIPGDTSGTWLADTGVGMIIGWDLGAGTSVSTTAGSWQAGNLFGLTGGTKLIATTGATFELTGVKAETGEVATPFVADNYQDNLSKCQRYYQQISPLSTFQYIGTISMRSTTQAHAIVLGLTQMRIVPTLSISAASDFLIDVSTSGYSVTAITIASNHPKLFGLLALTITSGPGAGNAGIFQTNNTSNAKLKFDAEL